MEKQFTLILVLAVFVTLGVLLFRSQRAFVRKNYGKKWLKAWGNKVYFWQSLFLVSALSTALVLLFLKWVFL